MRTSKLTILLLLISMGISSMAQDAKKDFSSIHHAYNAMEDVSVKVTYQVYTDSRDDKPFHTEEGELKRKGTMVYSRMGKTESIRTEDYYFYANHSERTIIIDKNRNRMSDHPFLQNADEIISLSKSIEYKDGPGQLASYTLKYNSAEYESVEVEFNKKTYVITRVVFFYKMKNPQGGQPKLEIIYQRYDTQARIDKGLFDYRNFLTEDSKTLVCNARYKNYKLINTYKKN